MAFYRRPGQMKLELAMAVFMILAGVLSMGVLGGIGGVQIGVGVLLIVLNIFFWQKPLVILHKDFMEMKAAPLAAKYMIRYRDIVGIEQIKPNKARLLVRRGSNQQQVHLPLGILVPSDRESLVQSLRKHIA